MRNLRGALDAERFASTVASFWGDERLHQGNRHEASAEHALLAALEQIGDAQALVLLRALGEVAGGSVAPAAVAAADRLVARGVTGPDWLARIGSATPTAAWIVSDPVYDDGAMLFTEFSMPGEPLHVVAVYADNNLGGMAKHVGVCRSRAEVEELGFEDAGEGFERTELSLDQMGARLRAALDQTPLVLRMRKGINGAESYAFARARALSLPAGAASAPPQELSADDRFALLDDFVASPEGSAFADDMDAQTVVARAIDFCADYADGRPLRWSPALVELFVTDWLPEQCGDDRRMLARVPAALEAWIRYGGRRRGVPEAKVDETVAVIARCRELLSALPGDYGGASSAA